VDDQSKYFEQFLWPHFRSAYNMARWLVGNHQDAEDIVQESFFKAYQAAGSVRGGDSGSWLLTIVRRSAINFLQRDKRRREISLELRPVEPSDATPNPESALMRQNRTEQVRAAILALPFEFREVLLLREMEEMSYKQIATVLRVPLGTVMSRLSRARHMLFERLSIGDEPGWPIGQAKEARP
jgi:RNA polymerase sigma-70 factor, ECF subfamily